MNIDPHQGINIYPVIHFIFWKFVFQRIICVCFFLPGCGCYHNFPQGKNGMAGGRIQQRGFQAALASCSFARILQTFRPVDHILWSLVTIRVTYYFYVLFDCSYEYYWYNISPDILRSNISLLKKCKLYSFYLNNNACMFSKSRIELKF